MFKLNLRSQKQYTVVQLLEKVDGIPG